MRLLPLLYTKLLSCQGEYRNRDEYTTPTPIAATVNTTIWTILELIPNIDSSRFYYPTSGNTEITGIPEEGAISASWKLFRHLEILDNQADPIAFVVCSHISDIFWAIMLSRIAKTVSQPVGTKRSFWRSFPFSNSLGRSRFFHWCQCCPHPSVRSPPWAQGKDRRVRWICSSRAVLRSSSCIPLVGRCYL